MRVVPRGAESGSESGGLAYFAAFEALTRFSGLPAGLAALVCAGQHAAAWMPGGRSWSGPPRALPGAIAAGPLLVCHTPSVQGRIRRSLGSTYDLLELFAFVHPARSCHPTPRGLCRALALAAPLAGCGTTRTMLHTS